MIRVATTARVMPAIWLALPLLMLGAWYVTLLPSAEGYGVAATGLSSLVLIFVGPFAAGCAAWEGSRLRRAGVWSGPLVRPRLEVAFWILLPIVGVATAVVIMSAAVGLGIESAWPPDPAILAVESSAVVAAAVFGLAVGARLPFPIAGPVALLVPFGLTALVPAMEPIWIRHLTSTFRDCCWIEQELAPSAALASAIINATVILLCSLVLVFAQPGRWLAGAGLVMLATVALASLLVVDLGYAPVQPRDPAALECASSGGVTLCTWPERRDDAGHRLALVREVHERWRVAGIEAPTQFTEADRSAASGGWVAVRFGSDSDDDSLISALAAAMLPAPPVCEGGGTGSVATEYLHGWLSAAGGMSAGGLADRFGGDMSPFPPALELVDTLKSRSPEARDDWMLRAATVSQMCDEWPAEIIDP